MTASAKAARPAPVDQQEGVQPGRRRVALIVLRFGVAAAILTVLLREIPISEVRDALTGVHPAAPIAAVCAALLSQCLIALRLRLLLKRQGVEFRVGEVLNINLSALFYGLFVPAGNVARGAYRLYQLARPTGRVAAAAAGLLFDRLLATAALGAAGVVFWMLDTPHEVEAAGVAPAALLVICAGVYIVLFSRPAEAWWRWVMRLGGLRMLSGRTARVREAAGSIRGLDAKTVAVVAGLALASQLIGLLAYASVAAGLGIRVAFVRLAWIVSVAKAFAILPIAPAGFGVREGVLVFLLGAYGIGGAEALALSLLAFAATELSMGLVGGLLEVRGVIPGRGARVA